MKLQPTGADTPEDPMLLNLTTQLYFPDEPQNAQDGIFDPALLVDLDTAGSGQIARFDFVLDLG